MTKNTDKEPFITRTEENMWENFKMVSDMERDKCSKKTDL